MSELIEHTRLKQVLKMSVWPCNKKHIFEAATGDNHLYYADSATFHADTHVISRVHFNKLKLENKDK